MRFSVLLILSTLDLSVKLIFILEINLLRLLDFNFEITLLEIIFTVMKRWYGMADDIHQTYIIYE